EEPAIRSRWQHDAVPPWRPLPPELIREIRATTIDADRWLRQPATFMRWRPDLGRRIACWINCINTAGRNRTAFGPTTADVSDAAGGKRMTFGGSGSGSS